MGLPALAGSSVVPRFHDVRGATIRPTVQSGAAKCQVLLICPGPGQGGARIRVPQYDLVERETL